MAIKLTKKYVVCKRHNLNANDIPRFDEGAKSFQLTPHQQKQPMAPPFVIFNTTTVVGTANEGVANPSGKPPPKKRGRKPKSYYIELEALAAAQKVASE